MHLASRYSYYYSSVGVTPVTVPDGFPLTPPFNIFKSGSTYTTDFNVDDYDFSEETDVTYYFSETAGVNGNSGLTPALPKLTIQNVISSLNAAPPAGGATFVLMTDYANVTNVGVSAPLFKIAWKSYTETRPKLSSRRLSQTFVSVGDDTYSWTNASVPVALFIVDETDLDSNGVAKRLEPLASQAAVQASPVGGVYFTDNGTSTVYFKLWDLRNAVGDPNIKTYVNRPFTPGHTNKEVFLSNLELDNSAPFSLVPTAANSPATAVFDRCKFIHSQNNGFNCDAGPTDLVILHECETYQNNADGNNYGKRGSDLVGGQIIEIGCIANDNGYGTGVSENGSTTHEGTTIIRINGTYIGNKNRNVHDVNASSKTWMIGGTIKSAKNQSDPSDSIDLICGIEGVNTNTEMWIDGVDFSGSTSLVNIYVAPGCTLHYRNVDIDSLVVVNDGTIVEY
jgi:hypothetical protein